jgi:hypothetical protein
LNSVRRGGEVNGVGDNLVRSLECSAVQCSAVQYSAVLGQSKKFKERNCKAMDGLCCELLRREYRLILGFYGSVDWRL